MDFQGQDVRDSGLLHRLLGIGTRLDLERHTDRPSTTKSMHNAIADLELDRLVIAHAGTHRFDLTDRITAIGATDLLTDADPLAGL